VFRRQALDRGAVIMKADKIVTGHNADDIAETVLMNRTHALSATAARAAVPPATSLSRFGAELAFASTPSPPRNQSSGATRPGCGGAWTS
jgi:hypothetical protein